MFKYTFKVREEITDCDNCPFLHDGFACKLQVDEKGLMIVNDEELIDNCPLGIKEKDEPIANFCL